ncbi:MAG: PAS domain S-box protein [Desulfobacteraceae bacterium]|nr:MAG: PAS domain S-box protein [Desulfobacteraceae bacterium]
MAEHLLGFEEYKTLVEQSPIMIWRSGTNADCDYFNERWLAFTGRTMEEEHGNGWAEGVHPDDFQRCLKIYLGAFEKREIFEMEYRLRRQDGTYRWIFDRGVPFLDPQGNFAGYIGSCIDVTDKIEAQEALRRAQMAEVKKLRGLLPICASCKNVRDDKGYWNQIEVYIRNHSEAEFSHSICPKCAQKLYPELYEEEPGGSI